MNVIPILEGVNLPESRQKVGIMEYQNSSWDLCDLTKKVSAPKYV